MDSDLRGWRTISWAAWGSGAVAGVVATQLSLAPEKVATLILLAWLIAGGCAILFVRSRGFESPRRLKRTTPLLVVVALVGGGAIGLAFALVGAARIAYDLPLGLALAALCMVAALGCELLVAVMRRATPSLT